MHVAHPCITTTVMRYPKDALSIDEIAGRYVESIVFQHSKLLSERIFFWRTPQKEEVDIILDFGTLLPVEAKFRASISDIRSIVKFMEKYRLKNGIIVTRDLFEERKIDEKTVFLIPTWLFLLTA